MKQTPVTIIGKTRGRRGAKDFGMYARDRFFHSWIVGQTGVGKSSMMLFMMKQDLQNGQGFCLLDPHGDLAEEIKPLLPSNSIYFDVGDPQNQYGYNPLAGVEPPHRPLLASNLIESIRQQWSDAWGVRMEHLLRHAILALLEQEGATLADIVPLFTDKDFRDEVSRNLTNPQAAEFWRNEYPNMNYKNSFDGVAPIANKLGAFLAHPLIRKALCEPEIPIDLKAVMDGGIPLIVNLSKGRIGFDTSNVLGGLLLSMLASHAYARSGVSPEQRRAYFLYADEFHNFSTIALASMLSELRKYKLGMVLAHQHLSQLKPAVLDALLGNCGTQIVFRVGAQDAPLLARHLGGCFMPRDLMKLPNYHFYIKLMIEGSQSEAFSGITINETI